MEAAFSGWAGLRAIKVGIHQFEIAPSEIQPFVPEWKTAVTRLNYKRGTILAIY